MRRACPTPGASAALTQPPSQNWTALLPGRAERVGVTLIFMLPRRLLILAVMSLASASASASDVRTGQDVIRAMHDKYAGAWYPTVTFVQKVVYTDGRPEQDMWEALAIPARLRIDYGPIDDPPRTVIFRDEMRYVFDKGRLSSSVRSPNILLVLGFDVYGQPPTKTSALLGTEGFDLSKVHEDVWEGRPAWVVGALPGDTGSKQFWVEKDRLLFLRVIQKSQSGALSDIRFAKYERLGGGWLATVVEFLTGGKETFREIYRDWRVNPEVQDDLFDVTTWKRPSWVK
jgi:hypothetical protein